MYAFSIKDFCVSVLQSQNSFAICAELIFQEVELKLNDEYIRTGS